MFISNGGDTFNRIFQFFFSNLREQKDHWSGISAFIFDLTKEKLILLQEAYIEKILSDFGLKDCRTYTTPMISNFFVEASHHARDEVIVATE